MNGKDTQTPIDQRLFLIFMVTFAAMTVFEFAGEFLYPYPPDWRSNLVTSLFTSGLAVIIAYFPLHSYYIQGARLLSEIEKNRIAEAELRQSEEKFRGIFDTINDGIHIHEIASDGNPGKFIEVNQVACRMLQCSREELLEHGPLDYITGYHNRPFEEIIGELSTTGHAIFETEHRRKDGTVIPVEINAHVVSLQGKKVIISVVRDITERKKAEEALHESEEKFRLVVENILDGVLIISLNGEILYRNEANTKIFETAGMLYAGMPAKNVMDFVAPVSRSQVLHDLGEVGRGVDGFPMEYQAMTATGRQIWIDSIGKRVTFRNEPAIIILIKDITSRKQMERAILRANKNLNLLSSITRHDINNQLQALNGYIELLQMQVSDPTAERYFTRIGETSHQITAMIRFTKEYEEIGGRSAVWQNLAALVKGAARGVTLGQVSLEIDLPENMEILADPLIVKVFFNLIDNALRHGSRTGTIRFSLEVRGDDRVIVCEDDGEGVVPGEKEKIFKRGFGKNTGFGLAITREILDISGITIRETGEPGRGARFEMVVPVNTYQFVESP